MGWLLPKKFAQHGRSPICVCKIGFLKYLTLLDFDVLGIDLDRNQNPQNSWFFCKNLDRN